ncbi:MAG: hypothetical protein FWF75_05110 [Propionibacteriaceae bacterium]|nr:hypothetical protein [Propionibacteriaceae bacterium]
MTYELVILPSTMGMVDAESLYYATCADQITSHLIDPATAAGVRPASGCQSRIDGVPHWLRVVPCFATKASSAEMRPGASRVVMLIAACGPTLSGRPSLRS